MLMFGMIGRIATCVSTPLLRSAVTHALIHIPAGCGAAASFRRQSSPVYHFWHGWLYWLAV